MSGADDDLDFTNPRPAPPPTPAKLQQARKEAGAGSPQLERKGFYVAMARHSKQGPVLPREVGKPHSILVIEDDATLLKLVTEVLTQAGFRVRSARNRSEINGEVNRTPLPDLVLLDVTLPDADGFQILERIRAHPKLSSLAVIMMTARSDLADITRGLALNADGYVTKPFRINALISAVGTVLGLE